MAPVPESVFQGYQIQVNIYLLYNHSILRVFSEKRERTWEPLRPGANVAELRKIEENAVLWTSITPFILGAFLYVHFRLRLKSWLEILVVLAWIFNLGYLTGIFVQITLDNWNSDHETLRQTRNDPNDEQMTYFSYEPAIYLCKMGLLFLYMHLSRPRISFRKTWWAIEAAWLTVAVGFANVVWHLLGCWPFSEHWSWFTICADATAKGGSVWAFGFLTGIMVSTIPFIMYLESRVLESQDTAGLVGATEVKIPTIQVLLVDSAEKSPRGSSRYSYDEKIRVHV